jgi:hypothetical protein
MQIEDHSDWNHQLELENRQRDEEKQLSSEKLDWDLIEPAYQEWVRWMEESPQAKEEK